MPLAQIQVLNASSFDLPASDHLKVGKGYRYSFVVRENPQDLTDWGYEDTWRVINPNAENMLTVGQTYIADVNRYCDGSTQGGMLRAVNHYSDFRLYEGLG